jgi:hypothetical protein
VYDLKWSESEKKLARRVFEAALTAELAEVMAEFKAQAAAAAEPDDMWSIQEHLYRKRREIDRSTRNTTIATRSCLWSSVGCFAKAAYRRLSWLAWQKRSSRTFGASHRFEPKEVQTAAP